ncbi:MAG: Gfo/Idh/MocA family oxidoreductase [Actinomycetota bacterium]
MGGSNVIRVGLVGCGLIGTQHAWGLYSLRKSGLVDVKVTQAYDIDPERTAKFASDNGVEAAPDMDALLSQVDVVWVCTWTAGHLRAVKAAAERGLPVFCEKPLAPTIAECEQLAVAIRKVPHQIGLILRHVPGYQKIAEMVHSGEYGRPMGAFFRDDQFFPVHGLYDSTWRRDVKAAGGGTLIEHSIHDTDVLAWILGAPKEVSARTTSFAGHPGIEDMAALTLHYDNGCAAQLMSLWHRVTKRTTNRHLEIFLEDAAIWMDGELGPVHLETSEGQQTIEAGLPEMVYGLDMEDVPFDWRLPAAGFAVEGKAFLDVVMSGDRTARGIPDVDEALIAHRIVDAAYRSAASGGVPLPIWP